MFYDRLKELCKENNITLTNLVKELNMSSGNLSRWKNGGVPKGDTLSALAEYFKVSTDYLLGNDVRKEKVIVLLDDPDIILTADEKWFILKLRQLDKEGRTIVEGTLISEIRRIEITEKEGVNAG